jgi:hypothetical protein
MKHLTPSAYQAALLHFSSEVFGYLMIWIKSAVFTKILYEHSSTTFLPGVVVNRLQLLCCSKSGSGSGMHKDYVWTLDLAVSSVHYCCESVM